MTTPTRAYPRERIEALKTALGVYYALRGYDGMAVAECTPRMIDLLRRYETSDPEAATILQAIRVQRVNGSDAPATTPKKGDTSNG